MLVHWIFLVLVLWAVPSTSLVCYKCWCPAANISTCDCSLPFDAEEGSHCTIIEDLHASEPYIELGSALFNSSYVRIKDPYYIIVDEAIFYNETTNDWYTKPKRIVYGCDWDLCNKYSLIASLPDSFKLAVDKTWLTTNIYGTGFVTGCHTCSDPVCGNETSAINYDLCPFTPCENSSTCALYDLWHDVDKNELCYRSECEQPQLIDEFSEIDNAKYKLLIEAIVYLSENRSQFDIWQLDIHCGVDNCSRPSIFQEIKDRLTGNISDLSAFPTDRPITTMRPPTTTTSGPPKHPLSCYNCSCAGSICPCTTYEVSSADNTYCTIVRENFAQDVHVHYGHVSIDSTHILIREFPYVLVQDSIIYNEITGRWNTVPKLVIYGCNWNLCNKPELLPYLPTSFQMRLSEAWLNTSVLGSGQPVRDCHECSDGAVCSDNEFIDGNLCPIQSCNTTCVLADTLNDPATTQQCYESFCAPEDSEGFGIDKHRVDIEGILYATRPDTIELWDVYIYCRADNCSRPEIFKELREQLVLQIGDVTIIFNQTAPEVSPIRCYDCYCEGEVDCTCDTISSIDAKLTYCTIVRNYDGENVYVYFSHLELGSSYLNVRELPYVLVGESILYNNATGRWFNRTNEVTYACDWDYCNKPSLLPLLPTSLQMSLPEAWLNSNILGSGQPVHDCHDCANDSICSSTGIIDGDRCPIQSCNSTCFVSNTYSNVGINQQCYQSYCLSEDSGELTYDTHRVEIEGIIYYSKPTTVELWVVYLYCQVDNCSRPEIFKEIQEQLVTQPGNLSSLFNQTSVGEPGQLRCYDCYCVDDPICACNNTMVMPSDLTYCTIIRLYDGQDTNILFEHIDRNSSRAYISEFPYLLVDESIIYNEGTGRWTTVPTLIIYGCNQDFCNDPRLVPHLPISFQMRLPEAWLNSSVLGTGEPQRECHECPDAPQCGTSSFLDVGRCPVESCNTTCLVLDTFDDPSIDLVCYQSYCLAPEDDYVEDRHRVEIEGILYGNRLDAQLELWEIDIYCRADDCSRPEIFTELKQQLTVELGDLSSFFNITTTPTTTTTLAPTTEPPLICYDCFCYNDPVCPCSTTDVSGSYSSYCTIIRQNFGENFAVTLEHIDRNSTRVYIKQFPYLLVEESIIYDEQIGRWNTRVNLIVYGCNTNYCNDPRYIPYLPDGFTMRMSETWLNKNVLGAGQPVRNCHECPEAPVCSTTDFIDGNLCPVALCNTTCLVSDTYDDPSNHLQCYQSFCSPPDSEFFEIDPHRVEMEGILYLNPIGRPVELWEIDIYCRGDDCSRPEIFNEVRSQFTVTLGDLNIFYNITTTAGSTTTSTTSTSTSTSTSTTTRSSSSSSSSTTTSTRSTTTSGGITTTTTTPSPTTTVTTTTASSNASTNMAYIIFTLFFVLISLINLY